MKYFIVLIFIPFFCIAQVGINTSQPNAQLDITITNSKSPKNTDGILIPRLMAFPKENPTIKQEGMLIYLVPDQTFFSWDSKGQEWIALLNSKLDKANKSISGSILVVNTMIDLSNLQIGSMTDEALLLKGFHEIDDGGGGLFYLDSARSQADHNGGTIIAGDKILTSNWDLTQQQDWFTAPTNGVGCWIRSNPKEEVNVKWFGTKNSIDAALSINEAIKYSHSHRSTVFIPSGEFIVNSAINLISNANQAQRIKIRGEYAGNSDAAGTILIRENTNGNQDPMISLVSNKSIPLIEIRDLTFVGKSNGSHKGIYIQSVGLNNPLFKNLHFAYVRDTPLHIVQNNGDARCEFVLIERMIVGMAWDGNYSGKTEGSRPNSVKSNGIWLEGTAEFDGVKITRSQFQGKEGSYSAPAILADVTGDVLNIEDTQIHGNSKAVETSIREVNISECYIEKPTVVAINLLNNKNSSTRGTKVFKIENNLFSQTPNILNIEDTQPLGSSSKGYLGNFYVATVSGSDVTVLKNIGNNTIINIGSYNSHIGDGSLNLPLLSPNIGSKKQDNISGYYSHRYKTKKGIFDNILFKSAQNNQGKYSIEINSTLTNDYGLIVKRYLNNSSTSYNPIQLGNAGGFKLKTSNSSGSNIQTAIFSDWSGNVGIGMDTTPSEKLQVNGNVKANSFIALNNTYADYVFEKYYTGKSRINPGYRFKSLRNIETFISKNHHIEGYKSISNIERDKHGKYVVDISEQSNINKEKVEELFIYTINQEKEITNLKKQNEELKTNQRLIEKDLLSLKLKIEKLLHDRKN